MYTGCTLSALKCLLSRSSSENSMMMMMMKLMMVCVRAQRMGASNVTTLGTEIESAGLYADMENKRSFTCPSIVLPSRLSKDHSVFLRFDMFFFRLVCVWRPRTRQSPNFAKRATVRPSPPPPPPGLDSPRDLAAFLSDVLCFRLCFCFYHSDERVPRIAGPAVLVVRPVPAGQRASVCGVSPAKDPEVSGSDRAGDEAIQQRSLTGR